MNASDVVGYTYEHDVYCPDCLPGGVNPYDPDNEDEVGAIFVDSEWDCPGPICCSCGEMIEGPTILHDGCEHDTK